jgi:hypothetical protein
LGAVLLVTPIPTRATEPVVRGVASPRFQGSSTLHDFSGTAPATKFTLAPGLDGSWTAMMEVSIDALSTDNGARDRKMREMFHSKEHPSLRAEFSRVVPDDVHASGRLPFRLTIAGASRDVVATVRDWNQTGDQLDFVAEFDISLVAFGLESPRVFLVVVDDSVHVTTEVSLKRE